MRFAAIAMSLLALASCGVDGEPIPPQANLDVSVSGSGIAPSLSVTTGAGPVRITIGRGWALNG